MWVDFSDVWVDVFVWVDEQFSIKNVWVDVWVDFVIDFRNLSSPVPTSPKTT